MTNSVHTAVFSLYHFWLLVSSSKFVEKVEFTTTKKTEEKRKDIGLITIKTHKESRPYTVKGNNINMPYKPKRKRWKKLSR